MKKLIIIICLLIGTITCYSQNTSQNYSNDPEVQELCQGVVKVVDKVITNGKNVVKEVVSEAKEYKKDIDECMPQETKDWYKNNYNSIVKANKEGYKHFKKSCHDAFRAGLRGEKYKINK